MPNKGISLERKIEIKKRKRGEEHEMIMEARGEGRDEMEGNFSLEFRERSGETH